MFIHKLSSEFKACSVFGPVKYCNSEKTNQERFSESNLMANLNNGN